MPRRPRLLIGIGNPTRRDDGAGRAVLGAARDWDQLEVQQLTPEIAAELVGYSLVVFADADAGGGQVRLEPVAESSSRGWSHHDAPSTVVALARGLYGFDGRAELCRIPAYDFDAGEGLSEHGARQVAQAAELLLLHYG